MVYLRKLIMSMIIGILTIGNGVAMDSAKLAEYETGIWKAYYAKNLEQASANIKLSIEGLCGIEDATPILPSYLKAVGAFGNTPVDSSVEYYPETILPLVVDAYQEIKKVSRYSSFDPSEVATRELDWWVARRFEAKRNPENVGDIMAEAYGLFYGGDPKDFRKSAYLRAQAARYRDLCQDKFGGITEIDWDRIQKSLTDSYEELNVALEAKK